MQKSMTNEIKLADRGKPWTINSIISFYDADSIVNNAFGLFLHIHDKISITVWNYVRVRRPEN